MTSSVDEQVVHVFVVLFVTLVFFFSGVMQMTGDVADPYTADTVDVDEPEFNATSYEPSDTNVLNTTWKNRTVGFNFTIPAGQWTIKGFLADSGWFSDVPSDYTFTIWNSTTVDNSYTLQIPSIDFNADTFNGSMLPRLDVGTGELRGMFSSAPRVVRWTLVILPMAFVITLTKVAIGIANVVLP